MNRFAHHLGPLALGLALAAPMARADVVYDQPFDSLNGASTLLASSGWQVHHSATAASALYTAPLPDSDAFAAYIHDNGHVWCTNNLNANVRAALWTDALDPVATRIAQVTFDLRSGSPQSIARLIVRVGSQWYIHAGFYQADADQFELQKIPLYDGGATWQTLDFVPGSSLSQTGGSGSLIPLPSGAVTAVGVYLATSGTGNTAGCIRLDNFRIITAPSATKTYDGRFGSRVDAYLLFMQTSGKDVYGSAHSPLFASMLDRQTGTLFSDPRNTLPDVRPLCGIRWYDRAWNAFNPMHDGELLELLYTKTRYSGDPSYEAAANAALSYFFSTTQNPVTQFFAWGEHLSWDLQADAPTRQYFPGTTNLHFDDQFHEISNGGWTLWSESYAIPDALPRLVSFALGLWDNQIHDKTNGLFSRHARYDTRLTEAGAEFPRYGGNMIRAWAEAYTRVSDPQVRSTLATAITTIVNSFDGRRFPTTDALPSGSGTGFNVTYWTNGDMEYSIDCERAASLLDASNAPLSAKLRASAARSDATFLKVPTNLGIGGRGFAFVAYAATLAPGSPRSPSDDPWTTLWRFGYGGGAAVSTALKCERRFEQNGIPVFRDRFLQAAQLYLASSPDRGIALHPQALAETILLCLKAYTHTGQEAFLRHAEFLGDEAAELFFTPASPLPTFLAFGTPNHSDHYETITGGDDLMLALYLLDRQLEPPPVLLSAASRLSHGSTSEYDLPLPLTSNPGLECRNTEGDLQILFHFDKPVTYAKATIAEGKGLLSGIVYSGTSVAVTLKGVADAQRIALKLSDLNGTPGYARLDFGVLLGDVNGNGIVDVSDAGLIRDRIEQPLSTTFRFDVNRNGSINAPDVSLVQSRDSIAIP